MPVTLMNPVRTVPPEILERSARALAAFRGQQASEQRRREEREWYELEGQLQTEILRRFKMVTAAELTFRRRDGHLLCELWGCLWWLTNRGQHQYGGPRVVVAVPLVSDEGSELESAYYVAYLDPDSRAPMEPLARFAALLEDARAMDPARGHCARSLDLALVAVGGI